MSRSSAAVTANLYHAMTLQKTYKISNFTQNVHSNTYNRPQKSLLSDANIFYHNIMQHTSTFIPRLKAQMLGVYF